MGIFDVLKRALQHELRTAAEGVANQSQAVQVVKPLSQNLELHAQPPLYRGIDIFDWTDEISRLKRENHLNEALEIATGCMDAMIAAAQRDPYYALDYYVIEVAKIQNKTKDFRAEIATIQRWLDLNIPPIRDDYRINLKKRLAKANANVAKEEGRDPSSFTAEWKKYLELEKEEKKRIKHYGPEKLVSSGRSRANPDLVYSGGKNYPANPRRSNQRRDLQYAKYIPSRRILTKRTFVAVDFETANRTSGVSACQIALVKVSNGRVVDEFTTLILPPRGYRYFEFTKIHGISLTDVLSTAAPTWPQIAQYVASFVGKLPVYAHNASFDAGVWDDLDSFYGTVTKPKSIYCTYRTAQRLVEGLNNYKLPTVVGYLSPGFQLNHHKADSDAEACAAIVIAMQSNPSLVRKL